MAQSIQPTFSSMVRNVPVTMHIDNAPAHERAFTPVFRSDTGEQILFSYLAYTVFAYHEASTLKKKVVQPVNLGDPSHFDGTFGPPPFRQMIADPTSVMIDGKVMRPVADDAFIALDRSKECVRRYLVAQSGDHTYCYEAVVKPLGDENKLTCYVRLVKTSRIINALYQRRILYVSDKLFVSPRRFVSFSITLGDTSVAELVHGKRGGKTEVLRLQRIEMAHKG